MLTAICNTMMTNINLSVAKHGSPNPIYNTLKKIEEIRMNLTNLSTISQTRMMMDTMLEQKEGHLLILDVYNLVYYKV